MKTRVILLSVALLCLVGCRSRTVRQPSVVVQPTTTQFPGKSALRTGSAETFGQAISQQILTDAIEQIAAGESGPVTVTMKFDVDITGIPGLGPFPPKPPKFPPPPTKEQVMGWDFCWIMCEVKTNQCYADCTNPGFSPVSDFGLAMTFGKTM